METVVGTKAKGRASPYLSLLRAGSRTCVVAFLLFGGSISSKSAVRVPHVSLSLSSSY